MRVGITKYCKLQGKMLAGSMTGSRHTSRALYQHRQDPYIVNSVWGIIPQTDLSVGVLAGLIEGWWWSPTTAEK